MARKKVDGVATWPIHWLLSTGIISLRDSRENGKMTKECLITTGATAKFTGLIQAALSPECLQAFADNGFTRLNFQCGNSFPDFEDLKPKDTRGLEINAFGFNKHGLLKEMKACQEMNGIEKGLIICHAGKLSLSPKPADH